MTESTIDVVDEGDGIVVIRLDRSGRRNALSIDLRDDLSTAFDVLTARAGTRVLVLTGAGETFSAGFDLDEFAATDGDEQAAARLWASSDRFHHTVLRCPVPVLCALNGPALAGGFDLAVLCDVRIAQPGVWFARPEIGFATPLYEPLRELVGGARARELCLTTRRVELDEAVRIGLVNRVAPPGDALAATLELAREVAGHPADAVRAVKAKFVAAAALAARPTLAL